VIRLVQHVPTFVETDTRQTAEAETQAELLAVPWVARYAADVESVEREGTVTGWLNGERREVRVIHTAPEAQTFHQFSLSDDCLMVEHNEGRHFWVVGHITEGLDRLTLPAWEEHPDARTRREAWNRGDTGPVVVPYRCAEHGVANADCCLPRPRRG